MCLGPVPLSHPAPRTPAGSRVRTPPRAARNPELPRRPADPRALTPPRAARRVRGSARDDKLGEGPPGSQRGPP